MALGEIINMNIDNKINLEQITENKYIIEYIEECGACKATGLYQGFAESGGAAVVCSRCKGTGKVKVKQGITIFIERKDKKGIKRVYSNAGGYGITDKDIKTDEGKVIHFSQYGVEYDLWKQGEEPKPIEELICPYLETNQNMQDSNHFAHDLYRNFCNNNTNLGNRITECKLYGIKDKCWKIYWELKRRK